MTTPHSYEFPRETLELEILNIFWGNQMKKAANEEVMWPNNEGYKEYVSKTVPRSYSGANYLASSNRVGEVEVTWSWLRPAKPIEFVANYLMEHNPDKNKE